MTTARKILFKEACTVNGFKIPKGYRVDPSKINISRNMDTGSLIHHMVTNNIIEVTSTFKQRG